jgi:DNA-directed RNA polymerase specialized sigma24 family protein
VTDTSQPTPEDHRGSRSQDNRPDPATEAFLAHRNLLFTAAYELLGSAAYELLGSAADAAYVLQETWLRWVDVDLDRVRGQRAYLVRITTRQALGRPRTLGRRTESYAGPGLPAPRLTTPDVAEDVELAESVSTAMLLVLETLTPTARAVLRLREVFELGRTSSRTPLTRVRLRSVRSPTERGHTSLRTARAESFLRLETRDALGAFQRAVETGDLQSLVDILAPDVVLLSDGRGS